MKRTVILLLFLGLVAIGGYFAFETWLRQGEGETVMVRIPEGASFDDVLDTLDGEGLVGNRAAFRLLAVTSGDDGRIRPGTYRFQRGLPHRELLTALVEGRSTVRVKVTFPEGLTTRRIASIAQREAGIDSARLVRLAKDPSFLRRLDIDASTAEGFLMPDTYFLFWGEEPEVLLRKMVELHRSFYNESLRSRASDIGLDPYKALILASIVEGEARVAEERPTVAGVYLNRLRIGKELQADPTIQYVLPDGPRRLTYADLRIESPYNTYKYAGLPPTPINNPGRASILATLEPEKHEYIYFVAKADGSGGHTFSRNDREHAAAVREYRQRVREQRRSAGD